MPRQSQPRISGRRPAAMVIGATLVLVLGVWFSSAPTSAAATTGLFRNVSVQVGLDGQITQVTNATVSQDASGTPSNTTVEIPPQDAVGDLPVRVQTAWWYNGQTGTDLSVLEGKSGEVTIQVTVENLTARATDVTFESDGRAYRQQAFIGVPLTVAATATLTGVQPTDVVMSGADLVTDGLMSVSGGTVSVQWARLLAPPILSPSAAFTLVADVSNFRVPQFTITVQAGLITDPSVEELVSRRLGGDGDMAALESSTIQLVVNVDRQLQEALDFVDEVHTALQADVTQVSRQTVAELNTSSTMVLGHLETIRSQLDAIQQSTQSGIGSVATQTRAGVDALLDSLDEMIGSTTDPPQTVGEAVDGCQVTLPQLAEGEPQTLASNVYLIGAQLQTLVTAFEDPDNPVDTVDIEGADSTDDGTPVDSNGTDVGQVPVTANCRVALTQALVSGIGDPVLLVPDSDAAATCLATPVDVRTVACAIFAAGQHAGEEFTAISTSMRAHVSQWDADLGIDQVMAALGPDGLTATLAQLRDMASEVDGLASSTLEGLSAWVTQATAVVDQAKADVATISSDVETITTAITTVQKDYDTVLAMVKATSTQTSSSVTDSPTIPASPSASVSPTATVTSSSATTASPSVSMTPTVTSSPIVTPSTVSPTPSSTPTPAQTSCVGLASGEDLAACFDQIQDRSQSIVTVGAWFTGSGSLDAMTDVVTVVNAKTPGACDTQWANGLAATSSASEIIDGLDHLVVPGCGASDLAAAMKLLVTGYDSQATDLADTSTDVSSVESYLGTVETKLEALGAAITAVKEQLDQTTDQLPAALTDLYKPDTTDPTASTGLLVRIQATIDQIAALVADNEGTLSDGDLTKLAQAAHDMATMTAAIWPDDTIQPLTGTAQCSGLSQLLAAPDAQGQKVVYLANRLYCANNRLGDMLDAVDADITTATMNTSDSMGAASQRTGVVLGTTSERIGVLSTQLSTTLADQQTSTVTGLLASLDALEDVTRANVTEILEKYGLDTDAVMQSLATSMDEARTNSVAVQQSLSDDFATLVANLGGNDPTNQTGLIGKLYSVSGQVGQIGTVLDTTGTSVTSFSSARASDMRDLNLRSAEFGQSQTLLDSYHPFSDKDDQAMTVFVYHLGGA